MDLNQIICNKKIYNITKYYNYYKRKDTSIIYYLNKAIEDGNKHLTQYLVEHGADINKENIYNEIPLFNACRSGNKELIKYLVEHGVDINKKNSNHETPLFDTIYSGNKEFVKYLVEHGVDISKGNNVGETPLSNAYSSGNKELEEYLLEQEAKINKLYMSIYTPSSTDSWTIIDSELINCLVE